MGGAAALKWRPKNCGGGLLDAQTSEPGSDENPELHPGRTGGRAGNGGPQWGPQWGLGSSTGCITPKGFPAWK